MTHPEGGVRDSCLAIGLSPSLAVIVQAADHAPGQTRLQDMWQAIAAERNGAPAPAPDMAGYRLAPEKGRLQITREAKLLCHGTCMVDASTQSARIDVYQDEGSNPCGEWQGIHRLGKGRLEIENDADDAGQPRPTHYATSPASATFCSASGGDRARCGSAIPTIRTRGPSAC